MFQQILEDAQIILWKVRCQTMAWTKDIVRLWLMKQLQFITNRWMDHSGTKIENELIDMIIWKNMYTDSTSRKKMFVNIQLKQIRA